MDKNSKPAVINAESYERIILHSCRHANAGIPEDEWKMVYGLLSGYSDDKFLFVKNVHPIAVGSATEVSVGEQEFLKTQEIFDKLDSEGKGHHIVGSYNSQPGLGLFMSTVSLINLLGFQAKFNDAVTILFDPTLLGKKIEKKTDDKTITMLDTGIKIFRLSDVTMTTESDDYNSNYHRVNYTVDGLNKFFFAKVLVKLSELTKER